MKRKQHFLVIILLLVLILQGYAQSECKVKYYINPKDFLLETKHLRQEQKYDDIIDIIEKKIVDSMETWHYYQLACMYALKGDTVLPFQYIYEHIDLNEFAKDILTDSDLEYLYFTSQWQKLKDTMINLYLAKYPDITDKELSVQLWLMGIEDQRYRTLSINEKSWWLFPEKEPSKIEREQERKETESHRKFIAELLEKKIFPTYSMVGEEASNAAILIIQHGQGNKLLEKAVPLLEQPAKQQQINISYYALMIDRYLLQSRKKQRYGTQYWVSIKKDTNGYYVHVSDYFFSPIEDEKNVNIRRKEVGLNTLEEMAEGLGTTYQYNPENDKLSFRQIVKRDHEKAYKQRKERE
jgi:hypothetical protein